MYDEYLLRATTSGFFTRHADKIKSKRLRFPNVKKLNAIKIQLDTRHRGVFFRFSSLHRKNITSIDRKIHNMCVDACLRVYELTGCSYVLCSADDKNRSCGMSCLPWRARDLCVARPASCCDAHYTCNEIFIFHLIRSMLRSAHGGAVALREYWPRDH